MEPYADVVASYTAFARESSDSPCFVEWSHGVTSDDEVAALIGTLPPVKQQPNLVFAAARWHGAPAPGPYAGFREVLTTRWDDVRRTVLARSTQTNEVGRLATLVPAFASFAPAGESLALIEVGASAGLCLCPDRYAYAWMSDAGETRIGSGPELECALLGSHAPPLPAAVPAVAWRAGIDLNPLDVTDPDTTAWLTNLVWPEQDDRRARLRAAIEVTATDPPALVRGDLVESLPELLEQVPLGLVPVVFHSAVIAYLEPAVRLEFDVMMRQLVADGRCHWVSNEGANVLPSVTRTMPTQRPDTTRFVLGIDGQAVALTHGHGRTLEWLG